MGDPLAGLEPEFRSRLESMYRHEPQVGVDGRMHPTDADTRIAPSQGMWLYDFCVSHMPARSLEIGMAYGYSTIYILAAIAKTGTGHHMAMDPYQSDMWHGIGLAHARSITSGVLPASVFDFVEERSDRLATDLARAGTRFDLIFIDGNHRFDDVLVDFYLYAPLCNMGGHIIFDDMWMSSIRTVVSFIRENRKDFIEVPSSENNISVFRKVDEDHRSWRDFTKFDVSISSK